MAKIVRLTAANIKKLKAVEIVPKDNVVLISGKNMAGKSSVLDSILMAFAGGKKLPPRPIRNGQTEAVAVVETEEYTISRTFTEKGNYLEVRNKDGMKVPSPQALLDKMIGQISFDPLEFFDERRYDAKARKKMLLDMLGLDFTKTDNDIKALYDQRTDVNREVARLKATLKPATDFAGVPDAKVSLADLQKELETVNDDNAKAAIEEAQQKNEKLGLKGHAQRVATARAEVVRITELLEEANTTLSKVLKEQASAQKKVDNFKPVVYKDTDVIVKHIENQQATNNLVEAKRHNSNTYKDWEKKNAQSQDLTDRMAALEQIKTSALAKSKMPIPGLTIDSDGLSYTDETNGKRPVEQLSDSEKLRVGVAIGMAMNPELKVLRIIDGSLLDEDSMKMVSDMVKDKDYQIWIEVVDSSGEVGIYIEDGEVVQKEAPETSKVKRSKGKA